MPAEQSPNCDTPPPARCSRCEKPRLVGDSYCLEHRREIRRTHARRQRRQLRWAKKMLRGLSMEELDDAPGLA